MLVAVGGRATDLLLEQSLAAAIWRTQRICYDLWRKLGLRKQSFLLV